MHKKYIMCQMLDIAVVPIANNSRCGCDYGKYGTHMRLEQFRKGFDVVSDIWY